MFAYCNNNPVMLVDSYGKCPYNGTAADFHRSEHGLPPMDCDCIIYGMSDEEAKLMMPGRYTSYERCFYDAIDIIEKAYINDQYGYERGMFIYKDAQGYYCISINYVSHSQTYVEVNPGLIKERGAKILAFIHTHPHDKNQYVFTTGEIAEMNSDWNYYVVAVDSDHTSVYIYTPHPYGTPDDIVKMWTRKRG